MFTIQCCLFITGINAKQKEYVWSYREDSEHVHSVTDGKLKYNHVCDILFTITISSIVAISDSI